MFLERLLGAPAEQYELVNIARESVLASRIEPAFDSVARRRGLLGRHVVPDDYALIIAPCNAVHTIFMRCALDLLFVSRDGAVVKVRRAVRPWRVSAAWRAFAVIEAAPGCIDRSLTKVGDVLALRERQPARAASGDASSNHPPGSSGALSAGGEETTYGE